MKVKKMGAIQKNILKLIEVQCNVLFVSIFGVELAVQNEREKESLECGKMHI